MTLKVGDKVRIKEEPWYTTTGDKKKQLCKFCNVGDIFTIRMIDKDNNAWGPVIDSKVNIISVSCLELLWRTGEGTTEPTEDWRKCPKCSTAGEKVTPFLKCPNCHTVW